MPYDVKCSNCYHLKNDWCIPKMDSPDPDILRDCPYFITKTNADRIRAMTDDKLAGFLAFTGCPLKVMASLCPRGHNSDKKCNARRCWLNWLKKEVKE